MTVIHSNIIIAKNIDSVLNNFTMFPLKFSSSFLWMKLPPLPDHNLLFHGPPQRLEEAINLQVETLSITCIGILIINNKKNKIKAPWKFYFYSA